MSREAPLRRESERGETLPWGARRDCSREAPLRRESERGEMVHAVALRFELRAPLSGSLKSKRAALRPIVDGLRHRFKVSVAEVDHLDSWQRIAIGVALVSGSQAHLQAMIDEIERFVMTAADIEVLDVVMSWFEED